MKVAIVGAGPTGVAGARSLAAGNAVTLIEHGETHALAAASSELRARGVRVRRHACVERAAVDDDGVDLLVGPCWERFDLALITVSAGAPAGCRCVTVVLDPREPLLRDRERRLVAFGDVTSVIDPGESACVSLIDGRPALGPEEVLRTVVEGLGLEYPAVAVRWEDDAPAGRVYFATPTGGAAAAKRCASAAVARMLADHPRLNPSAGGQRSHPDPGVARCTSHAVATLAFEDFSTRAWPLGEPAIVVFDQRSSLDLVTLALTCERLGVLPRLVIDGPSDGRTPGAVAMAGEHGGVDAAVAALAAGDSVAFAVGGSGAARAALQTHAPIVPLAVGASQPLQGRPTLVAIGEPLYPLTSCVDEMAQDIRLLLDHLDELALPR